MGTVQNYLSPEEINAYQSRIDNADTAYQRGLARLAYQRGTAQQDYGIAQTRATRQWDKAFGSLSSPYARRGVLRSGIFNRGFQDYGLNRQQSFADLDLANQRRQDGFNQSEDDLNLVHNMALTQVERERVARQAALAAQLRSIQ